MGFPHESKGCLRAAPFFDNKKIEGHTHVTLVQLICVKSSFSFNILAMGLLGSPFRFCLIQIMAKPKKLMDPVPIYF